MARKWLLVGGIIALVVAAPIAWYLISPLFIDRTVDEGFPAGAAAPGSPPGTTIAGGAVGGGAVVAGSNPTPRPPTATPAPSLPAPAAPAPSAGATGSGAPIAAASPTPRPATASPSSPPAATPIPAPASAAPASPVAIRTGQFHDVQYKGTGTATIFRLPDGKLVLRLENLDVQNGPDLYVYVSAAPDATDAATVTNNTFVSLGRLKGNQGNQNYDLPADLNLAEANSIVIWCQRFRANFVTAPLK
jgi:hypothetical protein